MPGLVEDLLRPESYPPPQPGSVALLATPLSIVFLTDREAWKVKRPLHRGPFDSTDPAARERLCHEEVRLNRRLAPHVYLGVLPVRRDAAGHSFARDGVIVDYAVRMRRLPDDRCARALLAAGRLDFDHIERLARRMADFYGEAAKVPRPGTLDSLRERLEEDLREMEALEQRILLPGTRGRVGEFLRGFLRDGLETLRGRVAEGRVVEAHGDLRLDHVFFEERQAHPTVVDAVDFHERFGGLDPAADAALLAADLEAAGRPDLGARFLARLAGCTDDFGLYGVVDFYVAWRAAARGKALGLFASEGTASPAEARRAFEEARRLFRVAERATRPLPGPGAVVAVGGVIGTGKTTLSAAFSRRMGIPVVGSDSTRRSLAGLRPWERAYDDHYTREFTRRTFDEVFRRAEMVLGSGRGVVLDATFRSRALRARARRLAERFGRPFLFVEASCPPGVLRERLRRRTCGPPGEAGDAEGLLERFWREYERVDEIPVDEHLEADTTRPADAIALEVEERLHHFARG